jgi:hypothetical protein
VPTLLFGESYNSGEACSFATPISSFGGSVLSIDKIEAWWAGETVCTCENNHSNQEGSFLKNEVEFGGQEESDDTLRYIAKSEEGRFNLLFPPELLCDTVSDLDIPQQYLDHNHALSAAFSLCSSTLSLIDRQRRSSPQWYPLWTLSYQDFQRSVWNTVLREREHKLLQVHHAAFCGYLPPLTTIKTTSDFNWTSFKDLF